MTERLTLRDYQVECVQAHFDWFAHNKTGSPLFVMPTASGKSLVIADFIYKSLKAWPKTRVIVLSHVMELLEQDYNEFVRHWGNIIGCPAGIYSAGLGRRETRCSVLFAGIQSVYNKADLLGHFDLVLVDEVHLVPRSGEGRYLTYFEALRKINPAVRICGYTATPYRLQGGYLHRGPDALFSDIAYDVKIEPLIEQGYLAPLIAKRPQNVINTAGLHTVGGDFKSDEVEAAAMEDDLVEDSIVEVIEWAKREDRHHWLIFGCGINHAELIIDELKSHGVEALAIFGHTKKDQRAQIVDRFKRGKLKALVNVGVLCLDEETEILTSNGWVGIDEMTMDHEVASWSPDGSIIFEQPRAIVRRPRKPGERMVCVDSRYQNIRVTEDHRMVLKSKSQGRGEWTEEKARDVVGERICIPVSGHAKPFILPIPDEYRSTSKQRAARIHTLSCVYRKSGMEAGRARVEAAAVQNRTEKILNPSELTLDHCRLIGFWLGDGTLAKVNGSAGYRRCILAQSFRYPKIVQWVDDLLARLEMPHSRHEKTSKQPNTQDHVAWTISRGTGGRSQAREGGWRTIEPYLDKGGSNLLWGLDDQQFEELLRGFWMADGLHGDGSAPSIRSGRHCSVRGTLKSFYELLQAIGAARGWRFSINKVNRIRPKNHSQQWSMTWCKIEKKELVNSLLQFEEGWRKERVWCVTSVTSFIVTRRRGKVAILGNTTGFNAPCCDMMVVFRPTKSTSLYVQIMGRGMRTHPGKESCLVLDFGTNVERHGPINNVRPRDVGEGPPPTKTCPECGSIILAGLGMCPDCGYLFEMKPKKIVHEIKASELSPIDMELYKPKRMTVSSIHFRKHNKPGKPVSMRVDYMCGMRTFAEWICFEHGGHATRQALKWWRKNHGVLPAPVTVDEAILRKNEIRQPTAIMVRTDGKYDRIVSMVYEDPKEISAALLPPPELPMQRPSDDDVADFMNIPF